jgi:plasmid maintenance system antidote protein VapI
MRTRYEKRNPDQNEPPDPRDDIRRMMKDLGWDQQDLAEVMQISGASVSFLLHGKQKINPIIAQKLAEALGEPAEYWLVKELRHEGSITSSKASLRRLLYTYFPIRELRARGWISDATDADDIANELSKIMGTNVQTMLERLDSEAHTVEKRQTAARKNANLLWLRKAEQYIERKPKKDTGVEIFDKFVAEMDTYLGFKTSISDILSDLSLAGIDFFVLPRLKRTRTIGACMFVDKVPCLVYAIDGDNIELFWEFIKLVMVMAGKLKGQAFNIERAEHLSLRTNEGKDLRPKYMVTTLNGEETYIKIKNLRIVTIETHNILQTKKLPSINVLRPDPKIYPAPEHRSLAGAPVKRRIIAEKYYPELREKEGK